MNLLPGWNSIESAAWLHSLFEKASLALLATLAIAVGLAYLYGQRRDSLADDASRAAKIAARTGPMPQHPAPSAESPSAPTVPAPAPLTPQAAPAPSAPQAASPAPDAPAAAAPRPAPLPVPEHQPPPAVVAPEPPNVTPLPLQRSAEAPRRGTPAPQAPVLNERVQQDAVRQAREEAPVRGTKHATGIEIRKSAELAQQPARRRLTAEQRAKLRESLKDGPRGRLTVRINPAVPDASHYGVELARFFRHEGGWSVRVDNSPFRGTDYGGMWIALRSADAVPPATGTLHTALAHAHIPVRPQPVWDAGGPGFNEIWLVVGRGP
ncbi:MAG TPA: hypothetical protein VFV71_11800 [Burkholderiales bacterium]|nr:hypothetical protein [Burkholderiales bacterium]